MSGLSHLTRDHVVDADKTDIIETGVVVHVVPSNV
jgi:hypothetical protein